jgi:hypothetical protein
MPAIGDSSGFTLLGEHERVQPEDGHHEHGFVTVRAVLLREVGAKRVLRRRRCDTILPQRAGALSAEIPEHAYPIHQRQQSGSFNHAKRGSLRLPLPASSTA